MIGPRPVAAIANREGQDSQLLLSDIVAHWREAGVRVVGVLAESSDAEGICSAAFLRDIALKRRYSIRLDAAPNGTACHLDAAGISDACADLLPQIPRADIVVLSKFGKTEARGEGLWAAFAGTLAAGTPLLTTVSPKHLEAWTAFAPDAILLEPDIRSIRQWWREAKAASLTSGPDGEQDGE